MFAPFQLWLEAIITHTNLKTKHVVRLRYQYTSISPKIRIIFLSFFKSLGGKLVLSLLCKKIGKKARFGFREKK